VSYTNFRVTMSSSCAHFPFCVYYFVATVSVTGTEFYICGHHLPLC